MQLLLGNVWDIFDLLFIPTSGYTAYYAPPTVRHNLQQPMTTNAIIVCAIKLTVVWKKLYSKFYSDGTDLAGLTRYAAYVQSRRMGADFKDTNYVLSYTISYLH